MIMFNSERADKTDIGAADMSDLAVRVCNLTKTYKVYKRPRDRLLEVLPFGRNVRHREFHALNDVSFEVKKGEALGIVGRNGAGKSTLLQIIAGTLLPTSGHAIVNGRVSALLELGSGFNPNFTGRENLYLNAEVLGLDRKEIDERADSIIEFADIGEYIDQPVKTYSSGMQLRLAFSVQASIDPEILIVDEALAVGDSPFQTKCYKRLRDLLDAGTTVILVTHSNEVIRSFCNRAIWLLSGKIESIGPAKRVSDAYLKFCMDSTGVNTGERSSELPEEKTFLELVSENKINTDAEFKKLANQERMGTGRMRIENFYLADDKGNRLKALPSDDFVCAILNIKAYEDIEAEVEIGITVKDLHGNKVLSISDLNQEKNIEIKKNEDLDVVLRTQLPLAAGRYYMTVSLWKFSRTNNIENDRINMTDTEVYDLVYYAQFFEMRPRTPIPLNGPVHAEAELTFVTNQKTGKGKVG